MSQQIIKAFPKEKRQVAGNNILEIAEFYSDTIQGEGIFTGVPAAFLRLQHCTLNCVYCDTTEVWRTGNPYTFDELLKLMEDSGSIDKFRDGMHLVVTGGSPLRQQLSLIGFFAEFVERFKFLPFIEVENECVIKPFPQLVDIVNCWNNSPKLFSSGNTINARYKPNVIYYMATLPSSWFKFVVDCEEDWQEIQRDFLEPKLIKRNQIILMPEGADINKLEEHREKVVDMAIRYNVRYCTREHIVIWNKNVSV